MCCKAAQLLSHLTWWLYTLWSILMFASTKVVKMESCRRRYHSVSNHSIKPRHALCLRGVGGGGRPRPNIRCHTRRQWMDNGYPSIFHASLSRGLKPTTMSISKQFDPFSWLIHQTDLICNPDWFPEERRVGFKEDDGWKILNLREPMTSNPKYCLEHSRWAMVFISVPWWLIYLVDGLFISQSEQTCIWVAGGKFRGVLFSGAVAQPCTSPSANWPRRVIRT